MIALEDFQLKETMEEKKEKELPPRNPPSCRKGQAQVIENLPARLQVYDAFPRECKFAFMTPGYYATGFRILDVYKTEPDFSEFRKLSFLEDPKEDNKWGLLRKRIPFPESRVTDLPGTRKVHYKNYCLRSLVPESAMSWRNSVKKDLPKIKTYDFVEEKESEPECICEE